MDLKDIMMQAGAERKRGKRGKKEKKTKKKKTKS
jgi:hypothetical protein